MARTLGDCRTELLTVAGVDVDEATALRWLIDRQQTMVARSRWLRQTVDLGVTDGSGVIAAPTVVELYDRGLTIDGLEYRKVSRRTAINCASGYDRMFVSDASEAGSATFEVFPVPDAGLAIAAFAAVLPPDPTVDDLPVVPARFVQPLIDGAYATALAYDVEQVGAADRFEARFDNACEELRREALRQYRGGPTQILIAGRRG